MASDTGNNSLFIITIDNHSDLIYLFFSIHTGQVQQSQPKTKNLHKCYFSFLFYDVCEYKKKTLGDAVRKFEGVGLSKFKKMNLSTSKSE